MSQPLTKRHATCATCLFLGHRTWRADNLHRSGPACARYAPRDGAEPAWVKPDADWCGEHTEIPKPESAA